ncbi:MAG: imidazoleglycerol-phosphate dehydratase HisB [Gemmatimonadetes bacterium]|nr:imidazoleglycerol-phosphate dehydratase HisB [Gemmatimonadota bacterium]
MSDERRTGRVERKTAETEIELELCLDGSGAADVETGVGFFDHMLIAFARHGLFDLTVRCKGDLEVDAHHTVEDIGICLGLALAEGVGDKAGLQRFGHSYVPMDEALARAVIDLSGRSYLVLEADLLDPMVGELPTTLVREFFRAVTDNARINLHLDLLRSRNDHHGIEALFKACARALDQATLRSERVRGIPSTKGSL